MVDLTLGQPTTSASALQSREYLYELGNQGLSPRARVLQRHEDFYSCREYSHHQYDWGGFSADQLETISPDVIVQEGWTSLAAQEIDNVRMKRPTAPIRLARTTTERFTGLLFGRLRKPEISIEGDEQSEDFLRTVLRASKFWVAMHKARTFGGSMGSALVTVGLEDGRFAFTAHNPKTVQEVVFADPSRSTVEAVLIQYVTSDYIDELDPKTNRPTGNVVERPYLYRRIIDAEWDMHFKKQPIQAGRLPSDLEPDPDLSIYHRLGFCPAVWIQNLPALDDGLDGIPDFEGAYQMVDTIDRINSQANRGLLANMDPTVVISPDPKLARSEAPIKKGSDNALNVGPNGSATYLEIGAAGITAGRVFAKDLKQEALDSVSCVIADPEKISGAAQSAKAIELIYEPMLEKTDLLREQYGTAIEQLGDMTLRMAREYMQGDKYPGRASPYFRLPLRLVEKDPDPDNPDVEPKREHVKRFPSPEGGIVVVSWGPYFSPTPQDIQIIVSTVASAYLANLIDDETAAKKIAPLFDVRDWKLLLRKIQEAKRQREDKAQELGGLYGAGGLELGVAPRKKLAAVPPPATPGGGPPKGASA